MTHLPTNIARPLFNHYLSLFAIGAAILLPGLVLAQNEPVGVPFDASLVSENGTFMHIADIDQDGIPDVVVSNEFGGNLAWYKNNGNGEFTENELEDVEENARIVRVADMNGDGIPDIIAGRYKLVCYYGGEDLEFEDNTVISEYENNVYDIHISDIDNDGDLDVFVGTITPDQVRWYRNDGDGNYTLQTLAIDSDEGVISHATPDINGDDLPDIVCAYRERDLMSGSEEEDDFLDTGIIKIPATDARTLDSRIIVYFMNQGNGNFSDAQLLTDDIDHPESVAAADLDGDGAPDILSASTDDSRVAWYKNTSREGTDSMFGEIKTISTSLDGVKEAIAADINGDGDLDVVAASTFYDRKLVWFENNGNGSFSGEKSITQRHIRWMDAADMDGDGDIDLMAADAYLPKNVFYYENQSPARPAPVISSFSPQTTQVDSIVTITGSNLGNNINNAKVTIGDKVSEVTALNNAATQLKVRVPDLFPGSYAIQLKTRGQTVTATQQLTIQPYLTGLSPDEIMVNNSLTLSGRNFRSDSADIQVKLNDQTFSDNLTVNEAGTEIQLQIPESFTPGDYSTSVIVNDQPSNTLSFTVIETPDTVPPAPVINSFAPQQTGIDSVVTVSGQYMNDAAGNNDSVAITAGGVSAQIVSISEDGTALQFRVPNLFPGSYTLTLKSNQQTATAAEKLIVQPFLVALLPNEVRTGNELTLAGTNFRSETSDIQVQLNDTILQEDVFVNVAGTEARITLPENIIEGSYDVSMIVNGQSSNSLSLNVINPPAPVPVDSTPPIFASNNLEQVVFNDSVFTFSASVEEDATEISQIIIRSGGIAGSFSNMQVLDADTTPYQINIDIPIKLNDPLGMKYQIVAINTIGLTDTISYHAYRNYSLKDSALYEVNAENPTQNDYHIIAIPFEGKAVSETWLGDTISTYDKRLWRLFQYSENNYQEYGQSGFSAFEPGRGYMLIRKDFSFDMQGQAAHLSSEPEQYIDIPLQAGWNLIGNPYPFAINWTEVVAANPDVAIPQPPKIFRNGSYSNATSLESFEGAFLRNEGEAGMLRIPLTARSAIINSRQHQNNKEADPKGWEIPLTLAGQQNSNALGGFGMHPEAHEGSDYYDDYAVPRFSGYLDVTFAKPSADAAPHTKDIVALNEAHVWEFSVNTEAQEHISLTWDSEMLNASAGPVRRSGHSAKSLWLLDLQNNQRINMLEQSSYAFMPGRSGSRSFKIFYADPAKIDELMLPDEAAVGKPYPNPAEYTVNIPLSLPKGTSTWVAVDIYDQSGRRVRTLYREQLTPGFHTLVWNRTDQNGRIVPPGMYFYKIKLSGSKQVYTGKIVFR